MQLRTPARPTSLARPWSVAGTLTGRLSPAVAAENFGHHLFLQFTDLYEHPQVHGALRGGSVPLSAPTLGVRTGITGGLRMVSLCVCGFPSGMLSGE